jgi:hypothetical protein
VGQNPPSPEDLDDQLEPLTEDEKVRELLLLGHYIKYNLFLMANATVFSAIYANLKSTRDAVTETRYVMEEFDRPRKPKKTKAKG